MTRNINGFRVTGSARRQSEWNDYRGQERKPWRYVPALHPLAPHAACAAIMLALALAAI